MVFNHPSWVDSVLLLSLFAPAGVSREANMRIPVIGTIIRSFQNIYTHTRTTAPADSAAAPLAPPSTTAQIAARCAPRHHLAPAGRHLWPCHGYVHPTPTSAGACGELRHVLHSCQRCMHGHSWMPVYLALHGCPGVVCPDSVGRPKVGGPVRLHECGRTAHLPVPHKGTLGARVSPQLPGAVLACYAHAQVRAAE